MADDRRDNVRRIAQYESDSSDEQREFRKSGLHTTGWEQ